MYEETTRNIRVAVEPSFLEDQSSPDESRYVWAYRIRIENRGAERVQLISRFWQITDARGRIQEVRGAGVVGEQPNIEPGGSYEYVSGAPLETPSGFMSGSYHMRAAAGEGFDVAIPLFSLDSPYERRQVH